MNIIPALPADFETVKNITQETIRTVYPHYYPKGAVDFFLAHHNDAAIRQDISENRVFLCISDSGETVGTVTVHENDIGRLFVLPQYQGNGFGGALLDFAENIVAKNYDSAILSVSFSAKAIYLKRGYQFVTWQTIQTENGDFLCFDEMSRNLRQERQS